jgi:uncharacterized protein (TIRG00374 family)
MKYLKIFLILAIVITLLYFFSHNVDFNRVIIIIKDVNPLYSMLFLVGVYLQFFIRSYRWGIVLKPHKEKISILTLYNYTIIGFFINILIPGRVGEPARGILLASEEEIKPSFGLASVIIERLIDILMMILIFLGAVFFIKPQNIKFLTDLKKVSYFIFPFIILLFCLFYLINREKIFVLIEKGLHFFARILPERIREKVTSFILSFIKGLKLNLGFGDYVKLWLISMVVWLFLIPFYWILMKGFLFGGNVSLLETIPYFSIIVMAAAIPTPGMAGSFDAASRHGLEQLYGAGVNQAAAYTLLAHFLILLAIIVPGLIAVWAKGLNFKTLGSFREKRNEMS